MIIPPFPEASIVGEKDGNLIIPANQFLRILEWSMTVQDAVIEYGGEIR